MAIDADLSSGLIDEDEARARREDLNPKTRSSGPWTGRQIRARRRYRWPVDYRHHIIGGIVMAWRK